MAVTCILRGLEMRKHRKNTPRCVSDVRDTPQKMALRIQYDLWYTQNRPPWLDLKILLMMALVLAYFEGRFPTVFVIEFR
jgi:hypothetical protein